MPDLFTVQEYVLYFAMIGVTIVGLFAFSWIPYRIVQNVKILVNEKYNIFNVLICISSLIIFYFWATSFYKLIFKCIAGTTNMHCSASRSGELLILFGFTVCFAIFEVVLYILKFLKRKVYESKI